MSPTKKDPKYNLKVVIQETGIKPDTLRAWERRYGLPLPERTSGGHRLYSDYDIELIKWLLARQDEGLRINHAVNLWKSLEAEGKTTQDITDFDPSVRESYSPVVVSGSNLDQIRETWIDACLAFDEQVAEQVLAQSFAQYPLQSVCLVVLSKGLAEIGTRWFQRKSTVQQEHFASALAIRRINSLIAASPPPSRSETILLACPPQEEHIFAPTLITLFLRQKGWNVIYLGANVPITDLEMAQESTKANVVIMNATMLHTAANLIDPGQYFRSRNVVFAYGGNIFNRLPLMKNRIPGYYLGDQLDNVVLNVENIISSTTALPEFETNPSNYQHALEKIIDQQFNIEAYIWNEYKVKGNTLNSLQIANEYLGKNLIAALKLGEIGFLKTEIDWVAKLMSNYDLPPDLLSDYLCKYANAVNHYLPEDGYFVADFLQEECEILTRKR